MNCKDCIHYEVCAIEVVLNTAINENCNFFKDKSKIIELPCKVGDKCITNEGIVCHINTITLSNDEDLLLYLSPDNKDPITIVKLLSEVTLISKESAEQALRERETK